MTALSEALLAAQRQAIGALAKPYVAGTIEAEDVTARLAEVGLTDPTDTAQLLAAWDVLREYGSHAPTNGAPRPPAKVTAAQRARIERTAKERNYALPNFDGLTMAEASTVIQTMDDGSYDADRWDLPF